MSIADSGFFGWTITVKKYFYFIFTHILKFSIVMELRCNGHWSLYVESFINRTIYFC